MNRHRIRPHKREPLTQEEASRLAAACRDVKEKLIVWTLLDTGLRLNELAKLRSDDIDWQAQPNGRIIVHGKGGPYGAESKVRPVPLTPRARTLLENHFALRESFDVSKRTVQKIVRRVANRARIFRPCSPHVLRHTFAVTCSMKGISMPSLQRLLGHDHLETTAIYLNISPEEVIREFHAKW